MAAFYSFDNWSPADVATFERHYNIALGKAEGHDAKIVSDLDAMKTIMVKNKAAELQVLPPHIVGVHPENRDRKLMSAAEMTAKGGKIALVGASRDLCAPARAWCVQDSTDRECYQWTVKIAASSEEFAEPSPSIGYGSVGCSHWNQFLTAVNQSRPTSCATLKDKAGCIDRVKLFQEDPTLTSLATDGLQWHVIKRDFVKKYPLIPRLFSRALNAEHNIAIGETWDQQLSSICSSAILLSDGSEVPWTQVKKQIAASQAPCLHDIPVHIQFIRKYGGGLSLSLMHDTLAFLNLKMPSGRKVSGRWIGTLTAVPLTTDSAVPRLVHAVFKCQACCHAMNCDDFLSRYVPETELKCLYGKNKDMALHAEQILGRLKKVMGESNRSSTLAFGELSIKIAEVVLGKEKNCSIAERPRQPFPVCMCVSINGVRAMYNSKFLTHHMKSPHEFRSFHFTFPKSGHSKGWCRGNLRDKRGVTGWFCSSFCHIDGTSRAATHAKWRHGCFRR